MSETRCPIIIRDVGYQCCAASQTWACARSVWHSAWPAGVMQLITVGRVHRCHADDHCSLHGAHTRDSSSGQLTRGGAGAAGGDDDAVEPVAGAALDQDAQLGADQHDVQRRVKAGAVRAEDQAVGVLPVQVQLRRDEVYLAALQPAVASRQPSGIGTTARAATSPRYGGGQHRQIILLLGPVAKANCGHGNTAH